MRAACALFEPCVRVGHHPLSDHNEAEGPKMNSLIRFGIVAAALVAAPLAASAADLPAAPAYKAPAYVAPSYSNWSGFYVGINGGWGFGKSNWQNPATDLQPKGALVGGTLGFNYQTGTWVWGIEGDIDYSAMRQVVDCGIGASCETKNSWLGTARLRLGYGGFMNWMPYITGGAAFGNVKATNSAIGTTESTRFGYTIGAGLEYMFYANWSLKVEYLYADLGKFTCDTCSAVPPPGDVNFKTNIVRAGINYRF
jgi:outer membrane immunogenic protein